MLNDAPMTAAVIKSGFKNEYLRFTGVRAFIKSLQLGQNGDDFIHNITTVMQDIILIKKPRFIK